MLRNFSEHALRPAKSLGRLWQFAVADGRNSSPPQEYGRNILVPSAWEKLPGMENYRGKAWLRTSIPSHKGMATRIAFGGVSHTGTVYVDGKRCGSHYDAFTPWDVVVPGTKDGHRELAVLVDNSFGPHSALHMPNDYFTYGGITRPVEAQIVPPAYIFRLLAAPLLKKGKWFLRVEVRLRNWTRDGLRRKVVVSVAGAELDLGRVTVIPGAETRVKGTLGPLPVRAWTPLTPKLYKVSATLLQDGMAVDDLKDRVGFREVRVDGKKLLLNGSPIRLRGVCRHEDHPQFGCSLPVQAMVTDLELMKDMGCNFVRSVHYPNDMRFLDLCDEMGILVWEESHARQVDFRHPKFSEQIIAVTREMLEWHINHPSIIIWGCLNECESFTRFGRANYARVLKLLKTFDGTRPVTFADCFEKKNLCLDLVDIVSWNRYDAWYSGDGTGRIEPALKEMLAWLHSPRSRGGAGKPVILSEFGAGAIYGCRNPSRVKWTEEYQADVLDESLRVYLNHPDVVGASIWQFCDVRVTREGRTWMARPRTMNNKGVVDEYRRPKLAYDTVKRRMNT